jgi:hypothetical protein
MYFGLHEQNPLVQPITLLLSLFFYIRPMRGVFLWVIVSLVAVPFIVGCKQSKGKEQFDFALLVGRWSSADTSSSQLEEWEERNDSTFAGKGYVLEGGDTTFFETLEIRKVNGVWTYFAKVEQQNGAEVIPFEISKQSSQRVEFANPKHDFPKKIGYELLGDDELQAYIEGPREGQTIRILFDYKKKN